MFAGHPNQYSAVARLLSGRPSPLKFEHEVTIVPLGIQIPQWFAATNEHVTFYIPYILHFGPCICQIALPSYKTVVEIIRAFPIVSLDCTASQTKPNSSE
jgi:hypothetical protein